MKLFDDWLTAKAARELSERDRRLKSQISDIKHRIISDKLRALLYIIIGSYVLVMLLDHFFHIY